MGMARRMTSSPMGMARILTKRPMGMARIACYPSMGVARIAYKTERFHPPRGHAPIAFKAPQALATPPGHGLLRPMGMVRKLTKWLQPIHGHGP